MQLHSWLTHSYMLGLKVENKNNQNNQIILIGFKFYSKRCKHHAMFIRGLALLRCFAWRCQFWDPNILSKIVGHGPSSPLAKSPVWGECSIKQSPISNSITYQLSRPRTKHRECAQFLPSHWFPLLFVCPHKGPRILILDLAFGKKTLKNDATGTTGAMTYQLLFQLNSSCPSIWSMICVCMLRISLIRTWDEMPTKGWPCGKWLSHGKRTLYQKVSESFEKNLLQAYNQYITL